ncbi:MAG: hypothetical protein IIA40_01740 [SAR324 cluster bacterium]|nr:hypothetical protein [SAR324 cluster bacterium]
MQHALSARHSPQASALGAPRISPPSAPRLLASLLIAASIAACAIDRQVISVDEQKKRQVAILTGTPPPEQPASAGFGNLTLLQAESSLRRLMVEVSTWISFVRGEPQPFLTPDQVQWARAEMTTHLPRIRPDQRLQLSFKDQFHHLDVEAEIYAEGGYLVYRFTKLASPDLSGAPPRDVVMERPPNFVALVEQAGQIHDYDRYAIILKDPVFVYPASGEHGLQQQLAMIQSALRAGTIGREEADALLALLEDPPKTTAAALRLYVEKRETLNKAREQGLFSEAEFQERLETLRGELTR